MEHFQKHENKAVNTFIAKTGTTFSDLSMLKKPGYLNLMHIFVMQVHFTHIEKDLLLTFRHNIPDLFGDKVIGN